jgi:hypothetical protein
VLGKALIAVAAVGSIAVVALAVSSPSRLSNSTQVTVTVTDSSTKLPISGATYTVGGIGHQTNGNGQVVFSIKHGTYSTSTVKIGYISVNGTLVATQSKQSVPVALAPMGGGGGGIKVTFSSTTPVNFLTVQTATVTNNGAPVVGAPLTYFECQTPGCTSTSGSGYHNATTNSNGQVIYNNHLPTGRIHIYRDWATVAIAGKKYSSAVCEVDITNAQGGGTGCSV